MGLILKADHSTAGSRLPQDGLQLQDFFNGRPAPGPSPDETKPTEHKQPAVYLKTFGCQMNVSDSELVTSILSKAGYTFSSQESTADVVLLNTCAIRDGAEAKVWGKLHALRSGRSPSRSPPVVGVLGCMAERLKDRLLSSKLVQVVAGPDAYRDLPRLLQRVTAGEAHAMNVQLSAEETYADITPVRPAGAHSAFVSIMRGCNNMCSFCIVPYTRGRERSRAMASILEEVERLSEAGVKEITLLGQNVNSYADFSGSGFGGDDSSAAGSGGALSGRAGSGSAAGLRLSGGDGAERWYASGFRSVYQPRREGAAVFADLLDRVASVDRNMRVRFTSPHPKDFDDATLAVIAAHPNICKHLHMPAQSGSTAVLRRMRRGYSRESYDALLRRATATVPGVSFSTDIIVGFCGETEGDHRATLELLQEWRFPVGFLFAYSDRERTHAARHYADDVPAEVKRRRLAEALEVFKEGVASRRRELVGTRQLLLIEGQSRSAPDHLTGRTDGFKAVRIPAIPVRDETYAGGGAQPARTPVAGEYVAVDIALDGERLVGIPRAITTLSRAHVQSSHPLAGIALGGCSDQPTSGITGAGTGL